MEKSQFQFTNPTLQMLNLRHNKEFCPSAEERIPVETSFSVQVGRNDADSTSAMVVLQFSMGKDQPAFPFTLEAEMVGHFKWDECLNPEMVNNLLSQNAPSLLLGYLRPIVSNIVLSAGFPPYTIPFMDFTRDEKT